jgi:ATP/maltotriose-dependent transcriptional regulator MalT
MLLGRGLETAAIDALIRGARQGTSGALIVSGDPGAGKSAILDYAAASAAGMTVVRAQGIEAESSLPFAALADVLRPMIGRIDRLPEVQSASLRAALAIGPPVPGDRFTTYVAALNLIAAFAETQPVLVIVDDLQWIDPGSAEALFFAARRISAERVAVLFAARVNAELPTDPAAFPDLRLNGLDHDASRLLASQSAPAIATSVADAIYRASGGNPLALIQIPALLSERQLRGYDPLPDPLPVGRKLAAAYQARLDPLPAPTRTALLLAAACGDGDLGTISQASRLAGVDSRSALSAAENAGLIELDGDLAFRHPLIRSAVYEAATPDERRNAHRLLAEALPQQAVARRAWHRAEASLGPDEAVASELETVAGEQRVRRAYAAAFHAFSRAADLSTVPANRVRRISEAAISALLAGRSASAVAQFDRALALVDDPVAHADLALLRGQIAIWLWDPMDGHRAMVAEAERVADVDPQRAALLLIHAAGPCFMAGDIPESKRTALRAMEMARKSGHPMTLAAAEVALAESLLLHGEDAPSVRILRELLPRLAASDPAIGNSIAIRYGAFCQMCSEDFDPALLALRAEVTAQRSAGAPSLLPYPLGVLSELEFRTGRWLSGYANASESVRLARETGEDNGRTYSLICLARFEAVTGRDDECQAHLDEASELAHRFGTGSIYSYVSTIRGLLAVGREQWGAARDSLEQVRRICRQQEMREPGVLRFHADLVEAYLRLGDRPNADRVLIELEEQANVTGRRWAQVAARRCRGMLAEGSGLEPPFEEAVALAREATDPFELARTELSFGEGLRRARRRGDARQHLRSALEIFLELGATPWIHRTKQELAATGERFQRETPAAGTTLTPQELQVSLAVARGLTNREVATQLFLSQKTIETHLGNAYGKLGIRSRTELTRLFAVEPERAVGATAR